MFEVHPSHYDDLYGALGAILSAFQLVESRRLHFSPQVAENLTAACSGPFVAWDPLIEMRLLVLTG